MTKLVRLLKAIGISAGALLIVFLGIFLTQNFPEFFATAGLLMIVVWVYWLLGK